MCIWRVCLASVQAMLHRQSPTQSMCTSAPQVRHLVQEQQAAAVLMAYGISAAGKTYTIEGTRSEPGLLPRALDLLFQVCCT